MRRSGRPVTRLGAAALAALLLAGFGAIRARADGLLDMWADPQAPFNNFDTIFPNWSRFPAASFELWVQDDVTDPACTDGPIVGVTILNYGDATGGAAGDLTGVYFSVVCGSTVSAVYTLTYAGVWTIGVQSFPVWTWAGTVPWVGDPCAVPATGCDCFPAFYIYADVGPCPTEGATVQLGPSWDPLGMATGITDICDYGAPWSEMPDSNIKTIRYVMKNANADNAAPGDTVMYTIYYGKPGTAALTNLWIMDSMPPFTHLVPTAGSTAPDPGWDPDPGPPVRLRWTIAGISPTGGATGSIVFGVTVDWGNGEGFEPGSGDIAAPEGSFLFNQAHLSWDPGTGGGSCAPGRTSGKATTVVRRYLFWIIGDNDVLFSASYGQPPDEMIYSVFIKNMSVTKTWWDVRLWDTVPPEVDPWCQDCGLEDPCVGWTMTPSGCIAASGGRVVTAGSNTLLTWHLDMPPAMTVALRWKAKLRDSVSPSQTAINTLSIRELGRVGIVDGTGDAVATRRFTHLAPVVLPTTYVSYVGYAGANPTGNGCRGFYIAFFPLNKKVQFELRGIEYQGTAWSQFGGVSDSIGCMIGDCLGGFPGAGSCGLGAATIPGGGFGGCKVERAPAKYDPPYWQSNCPTFPMENIYKITSNAPVLWQVLTYMSQSGDDYHTYAPASTLSYTGMMHYMWRACDNTAPTAAGYGMSLTLINTAADPNGAYVPTQPTTVHLFKWDLTSLSWQYRRTWDIDGESASYDMGTLQTDDGPWRTVSSETQLIVNEGMNTNANLACCCGACANDFGHMAPSRETGASMSGIGSGNIYGITQGFKINGYPKVIVGNCGAADASYEIWRYVPDNPRVPPLVPSQLAGSSGYWVKFGTHTVPWGLLNPSNPDIYPFIGTEFDNSSLFLFKIKVTAGGPIQVQSGAYSERSCAGGSVLHSAAGGQTGSDFWFNQSTNEPTKGGCVCNQGDVAGDTPVQTLSFFCPKKGMVVRMQSDDGASATYTTNASDECVSFTNLTMISTPTKRNWRVQSLTGAAMVGQYIQCNLSQKGYTAPFLVTGTHYAIITPPVVYSGQSFWITVVVLDSTGSTKEDYCGTTSFTSTDPAAKMETNPMDNYNFAWTSATGGCAGVNNNGVKIFVNVTFNRLGLNAIVAVDVNDGSITGVGVFNVVGADVKLSKEPRLAVAASGDTIRFKVCWSNYSSASAFTFVITDAIPMGMTFVPEAGASALDCGNTDGVLLSVSGSTVNTPTMPIATAFGSGNPVAGTRWLRWTVPVAGVQTSGCACYRAAVN